MANTEHSAITDPSIHEPKGAASATVGKVYVSDGAGSGVWTVDNTHLILVVQMLDISTANSSWVVSPVAGTILNVSCVLQNAITSANANITLEIGGVAVTNGGISVAYSGSAAGTVDYCTPTAANAIAAFQPLEIISDGASGTACRAWFTVQITPT